MLAKLVNLRKNKSKCSKTYIQDFIKLSLNKLKATISRKPWQKKLMSWSGRRWEFLQKEVIKGQPQLGEEKKGGQENRTVQ